MTNSIILLFILGIAAWFWFDTQRSQEMAINICKQVCGQLHLQLLDQTIALKRIRFKRNNRGILCVQRTYQFEFSDGGNNRQRGMVIMRGISMEMLEIHGYRVISPV